MQPLHWDDWGRVLAASALPALLPLLFPPRNGCATNSWVADGQV